MDKSALEHISESVYSHPISNDTIEIRLKTKLGDDIKKVELLYAEKFKLHKGFKSKEIVETISDEYFTYYITHLKLNDKRLAYIFKLTTLKNHVFYFSESGVTEDYDIKKGNYDFFQVPYINDLDVIKIHKKFQNRVVYQIFVDRFNKSVNNNNPRINIKWGDEITPQSLAGGNLKGITEKLDYLSSLGVDALYLTPIFQANTNHKYDTVNYFKIDSDFGDETDLKTLIKELHKRKMIIILDGVFNHIALNNPIFEDVIKHGNKSKYYKWFYVHGKRVNLLTKNYETFAYTKFMPRLNLNNPEVQDYILNIAKHYVEIFKIDGYRLDVSDEIPHSFWIRFNFELKKLNKDLIIIGENRNNAHAFLNSGFEFDSIMNYSVNKNLLNYIAWEKYTALQFKNKIVSDLMRYKRNVNYNLMNLVSSHDVARFITICGEDEDKFLLGYAFIFMHIGIPCIYYGDEIGINGGGDPKCRKCFERNVSKRNYKILSAMKLLIKYHKIEKINERDYKIDVLNDMVVVTRKSLQNSIILYINLSGEPRSIKENGDVLVGNKYSPGVLENKGFVLIKK